MVEFAYTTVPGKVPKLLEKVRTTGVPPSADTVWLKRIGFTSSNDKSLIGVLRQIGFISGKTPTTTWTKYRGNDHKDVLGKAIREGYKELYAVYDDAHSRSNPEITHVFSTTSSAGTQAISKTVGTFKALVSEAEFDRSDKVAEEKSAAPVPDMGSAGDQGTKSHTVVSSLGTSSIHLNIQIHISPEATNSQIEAIFSSMSKHIYNKS